MNKHKEDLELYVPTATHSITVKQFHIYVVSFN